MTGELLMQFIGVGFGAFSFGFAVGSRLQSRSSQSLYESCLNLERMDNHMKRLEIIEMNEKEMKALKEELARAKSGQ